MSSPQSSSAYARDGYLDGVPCFVDTSQPDIETAQRFYGGVLG